MQSIFETPNLFFLSIDRATSDRKIFVEDLQKRIAPADRARRVKFGTIAEQLKQVPERIRDESTRIW